MIPVVVKPHLSSSQLDTMGKCGLRYEFRYMRGIISPPGVAAIIGKGTHAATEYDLGRKMATGSLGSADEVATVAADATREAWADEQPTLDDGERALGVEAVRGDAVDTAVSLATLHHAEVAPLINPVAVEQRFRLELEGFPYDLVGIKDVVEPTGIADTKTSGKAPPSDAAEISTQLTMYHLDERANGRTPDFVRLDYLVKGKRPRYVPLVSSRTIDDHAMLLRRVELAARTIEAGAFSPTNPDNWWCSAKWCGYHSICPLGSRKAVAVGISARPAPAPDLTPGDCGW